MPADPATGDDTAGVPATPAAPAPTLGAAPARGLVPQAVTALRTAVLPSFRSAMAASNQPR